MAEPIATIRVSSASSKRIRERDRTYKARKPEEWQNEAYQMVEHDVPESGYVVGLKADAVSLGSLRIREWDPDTGHVVDREQSDMQEKWAIVERVLRYLEGPDGHVAQLLRDGAYHHQIAGEAIFVGEVLDEDGPEQLSWTFYSVLEVKDEGDKVVLDTSMSNATPKRAIDDASFVARYHKRAGAKSGDATSEIYRALPILREIAGATEAIDSLINSRLAAGLLGIPDSLSVVGPADAAPDDDPEGTERTGTMGDAVSDHLMAPITNPASGARVVPIVVEGPGDELQKIVHIPLGKAADLFPIELREKALVRLARSLDAPPSVMQGKDKLNHWNVYAVDADLVRNHIVPIGNALARFLTTAYLRNCLIYLEDFSPEDARRFSLVYDFSKLVTRPNAEATATNLYDRGEVTGEYLRRSAGLEDGEGVPDEAERARRIMETVATARPALAAQFGFFEQLGIELADGAVEAAETLDAGVVIEPAPEGDGTEGDDVVNEPESRLRDRATVTLKLTGYADASLARAIEKATNQVVSKANREPSLRGRLAQLGRASDVLCSLSGDEYAQIGIADPTALLKGMWEHLLVRARAEIQTQLQAEGVEAMAANEEAHRRASQLVNRVNGLARNAFKAPLSLATQTVDEDLVAECVWGVRV